MTRGAASSTRAVLREPGGAHWARRGVEAVLLAGLIFLGVNGLWLTLYGASARPFDFSAAPLEGSPAPDAVAFDLSALTQGELFDARAFGQAEPASETASDAPETELDLTLHSARARPDPSAGTAIIEVGSEGQRAFPVGGEILDGVTLEAVYLDRVIINRRGVRESVFLREDEGRPRSIAASIPQASSSAAGVQGEPASAPALSATAILQRLRFSPEDAGGAIRGYRVGESADPQALRAAGLQVGDLITRVNGISLTRRLDFRDLYEDLEDAQRLVLTVERNGSSITVEWGAP